MTWSRDDLTALGFRGFVPFAALPDADVPAGPGVYVVLRPSQDPPTFLDTSPAGRFKGKDPSAPVTLLDSRWVPDSQVVYIGKAAGGVTGRRGLRKRLDEYRRFGEGRPVGHWGGRYVWQLEDSATLLVAWRTCDGDDPAAVESALLQQFHDDFGSLPYANLRR